ncbi:MAG: TonB-dependent receptor [Bacteroidota bacterium]|nr:TonB-dependent receptor [Bacteroidota bacterium]
MYVRILTGLLFWSSTLISQSHLSGYVLDQEGLPYEWIPVRLEQLNLEVKTNDKGFYQFSDIPFGTYAISMDYGYDIEFRTVVIDSSEKQYNFEIQRRILYDELIVKATSWGSSVLSNSSVMKEHEIKQMDIGKDIPYVLNHTPSLVAHSDAGNGIGYSALRIRGIDPAHTQVSINGIPLNDAESSLAYFVDVPDILSSADEVSVHRGFVPGRSGPGGFGAAVDIHLLKLHLKSFAHVNYSGGSYNTHKFSAMANSGLFENFYNLEIRLSKQTSDGFIQRSSSNLKSFFISGSKLKKNYGIQALVFSGTEEVGQAWNGLPIGYFKIDSLYRFNLAGTEKPGQPYDHEIDHYSQTHAQFFYTQKWSNTLLSNFSFNYTRGKGYFENYKANQPLALYNLSHQDSIFSDLILQQGLDNHFFFTSLNVDKKINDAHSFLAGINFLYYSGKHTGLTISASIPDVKNLYRFYYLNTGIKNELNPFIKYQYQNEHWILGIDIHSRLIQYSINGTHHKYGNVAIDKNYLLFSPKLFGAFSINKSIQLNGVLAYFQREPNREDVLNNSNLKNEQLIDMELGMKYTKTFFTGNLNLYWMQYQNQLVNNGRINDVGEALRINLDQSFRKGIEITLLAALGKQLMIGTASNFSVNKINEFKEFVPVYNAAFEIDSYVEHTISNAPISYSPGQVHSLQATYYMVKNKKQIEDWSLRYEHKFVNEMYLDNSGSQSSIMPGYDVGGISMNLLCKFSKYVKIKTWVSVQNLYNERYTSNGWIFRFNTTENLDFSQDPSVEKLSDRSFHNKAYFPQALRHFMFGVSLIF